MIFTTVGTHEQQFNRLLQAVDELQTGLERVVQFGYSDYPLKHCEGHKFMPFEDITRYMQESAVVITHSGTGSVMLALSLGRTPVVSPRYVEYGEHVDDHQLELVQKLEENKLIIPYYKGDDLAQRIEQARGIAGSSRKIEPDPRLIADLGQYIDSLR